MIAGLSHPATALGLQHTPPCSPPFQGQFHLFHSYLVQLLTLCCARMCASVCVCASVYASVYECTKACACGAPMCKCMSVHEYVRVEALSSLHLAFLTQPRFFLIVCH